MPGFTITGAATFGSGVRFSTDPYPILAIASSYNTVNATVGIPIASFYPFSSVQNGVAPYTYFVSAGVLPSGLLLDSNTGIVYGALSTQSSANVTFTVRDVNNVSASTIATISFNTSISAVAGPTTAVPGYQNSAITSFTPFSNVTGGTTPYTYFVSSGTLPTGISLNPSTGVVSGTPSTLQGASNVTFSVRDVNNATATTTVTVSFTVNVVTTATAGATTTVSGYQNTAITNFNPFASVTGGYSPYTYFVSSGTLPTGISLDPSTGLVSGTPTTTYTTANVTFSVRDVNNVVASTTSTISFTVNVVTTATAGATTTVSGSQNTAITNFNPFASVTGGYIPYTYFVSSGTLPTGISLNPSTGLVSGTPTTTYTTANVTFSVRDVNNVVASTTRIVSFTVNVSISAVAGATTTVSGEVSLAITSFNAFSSVSNGYTPYVYSVSSGTLPTGIALSSSTGAVSGTPSAAYPSANVVFSVTDNSGIIASTTTTVNFTIAARISAVAGATTTVSQQQNTAITSFNPFSSVSNGVGAYTYFVSSGTLPTGISLNPSTGLVSGTPTVIQSAANVVFSVRDSLNVTAVTTVTVSFTVTAPPPSPYTVNYLVVAGGGGGGGGGGPTAPSSCSNRAIGGGGGAGGVRAGCLTVDPTTGYPVVIGTGGTGGLDRTPNPALPGAATAGGPSTFSTITATGGGAGAGYIYYPFAPNPGGPFVRAGSSGGSGGGATAVGVPQVGPPSGFLGYSAPAGSPGTPGQGFPGGISGGTSGINNTNQAGGMGGGGGATGPGGNGGNGNAIGPFPAPTGNNPTRGGPGGAGYTWPVNGVIYGGGGGGAGPQQPSPGPAGNGGPGGGGTGGWGPAGPLSIGTNGTTNRGGGGGGGSVNPGGNGGPGVVLISYTNPTQRGTGGTVTNAPGQPTVWIHTFTAPGTYTAG